MQMLLNWTATARKHYWDVGWKWCFVISIFGHTHDVPSLLSRILPRSCVIPLCWEWRHNVFILISFENLSQNNNHTLRAIIAFAIAIVAYFNNKQHIEMESMLFVCVLANSSYRHVLQSLKQCVFFTWATKIRCKLKVKTISPSFHFYLRVNLLLIQILMEEIWPEINIFTHFFTALANAV